MASKRSKPSSGCCTSLQPEIDVAEAAVEHLAQKGITLAFHAAIGLINKEATAKGLPVPLAFEQEMYALAEKYHLLEPDAPAPQ